MNYTGNAIYDYVSKKNLNFYYFVESNWTLIYGNSESVPKMLVFAQKVDDISKECTALERKEAGKAYSISRELNLPFVYVRFMGNSSHVSIWDEAFGKWKTITYTELRNVYEKYGVVRPGTPRKAINQYSSSPYHDWQRSNLGKVTVSDIDLIKNNDDKIEIIELKRSKISLERWKPYENDFPNFALLINTVVASGKDIPFKLYYNLMYNGERGQRMEDISKIKAFDFKIPDRMISVSEVQYSFNGYYKLEQLIN